MPDRAEESWVLKGTTLATPAGEPQTPTFQAYLLIAKLRGTDAEMPGIGNY